MTIILRSKTSLTASAPYLVPALPGVQAAVRYAAMTVPGKPGDKVLSVPDAAQIAPPATAPATSTVTVGEAGGIKTADSLGGADGKLSFGGVTFTPTESLTALIAWHSHTGQAAGIIEAGSYRVALKSTGFELSRGGTGFTAVPAPVDRPTFAAIVLDGASSVVYVNGTATPVALPATATGIYSPFFGRNATGGTTRWIDFALVRGALTAGQAAAIRDSWKTYYPILP